MGKSQAIFSGIILVTMIDAGWWSSSRLMHASLSCQVIGVILELSNGPLYLGVKSSCSNWSRLAVATDSHVEKSMYDGHDVEVNIL